MKTNLTNPLGTKNFTQVNIGPLTFFFSYETLIALESPSGKLVIQNYWSNTTGRHLNYISHNHKERLPEDEFKNRVSKICTLYKLCKPNERSLMK